MDDKNLHLAEEVINLFREKKLRLVTAESCTGGLIAATLTEIPGSSEVVEGGFITYSNDLKNQALDIDPQTIEEEGAVSQEVALFMSYNALSTARKADVAIAVTGVAGPGGGSDETPVGTVCFCLLDNDEIQHEPNWYTCNFSGNRREIRRLATQQALNDLLEWGKRQKPAAS